jgi:hypothetical protein
MSAWAPRDEVAEPRRTKGTDSRQHRNLGPFSALSRRLFQPRPTHEPSSPEQNYSLVVVPAGESARRSSNHVNQLLAGVFSSWNLQSHSRCLADESLHSPSPLLRAPPVYERCLGDAAFRRSRSAMVVRGSQRNVAEQHIPQEGLDECRLSRAVPNLGQLDDSVEFPLRGWTR